MSSSLLSQRLKFLEREGVVERRPTRAGSGFDYFLTAAGRELEPVIMQLGEWGARWVRSRLATEEFTDLPQNKRHWWLVSDGKAAVLCVTDPGFEVDLLLVSDLRTMTAIWVGDVSLNAAPARGGPPASQARDPGAGSSFERSVPRRGRVA
jgi:hypothetical protein